MSKARKNYSKKNRYKTESFGKSVLDDNPTLTLNHYWTPKVYRNAVNDVINAYKNGVPFNKAVDMAAALDPNHISRNKLAEHTLKTIANDY